ncbi:MAG: FecCD family ABC transporter permease [Nocardioides sp.]|uniref:FecCD family ABC transporter permease n=1 Tax=Nocardioides sp. TaxID=35761 RepID=UPI003F019310
MVVALLVAALLSASLGAEPVPLSALWDASDPEHGVAAARTDRTLLAAAVGAALGMAGALLQGLTRNPIADPGLLGINAGASLAMVLGISVLGVSGLQSYVWFAFAGAGVAALLVHGIASMGPGGATPVKIAVAGAALTAAATSLSSGVLLLDRATMVSYRYWSVGTVGGRGLEVLLTGLPFLAVGALLALNGSRLLDALALGDDVARGLGRRTAVDRVVVWAGVILLAGTATALAGPIGFVGLLVPHTVRALVGPVHARLIPACALVGATLVLLADTAGRLVLPPSEVQVGIMTAAVGVPFFLLLVRRSRGGAL